MHLTTGIIATLVLVNAAAFTQTEAGHSAIPLWASRPPAQTAEASATSRREPQNMGSSAVPLDSWIYPLFERLAAFGYVPTVYTGMRPWTRMECARMIQEADEFLGRDADSEAEAGRIYQTLTAEFASEIRRLGSGSNLEAGVDSIYSRVTVISGPALRDGYHFGQTLINDYGRPYAEGFNNVTGVTAHAVAGPLSFSLQGEYQHAPAVASDASSVLLATAQQDGTLPLSNRQPEIRQFRLLESAVSLTWHNLQVSFGRQSLWLGPGASGPFLFTNNAAPIPMVRIDRVAPFHVLGISRFLGPARAEFFLGQLSGHHWILSDGVLHGPVIRPQPYLHGGKIGFKPSPNLEFGLGYTVLFGGPGIPFTWHNFFQTFSSFNESPGSAADPGDRRSTFDFSYRVPYLRHWLTIYADSLVEDEISPLGSTRPSMRMGMYFSHLPKLSHLDLRLEGLYTDVPGQQPAGFLYWNGRYRSGYTQEGTLLASWIGRQGRGGQAWATYWLSPRSQLQFNFRHVEVDQVFIGGGRLNDFGGHGEFMLRSDLGISGFLQYEQWNFPVLSARGQSNFTSSVQLTFYPHWQAGKEDTP